jgi:hypothetical protein
MINIKITMKDGTVHNFEHKGRAGGSWTNAVRYEGEFVIITDEWNSDTAFPSQDVEKVETVNLRSW